MYAERSYVEAEKTTGRQARPPGMILRRDALCTYTTDRSPASPIFEPLAYETVYTALAYRSAPRCVNIFCRVRRGGGGVCVWRATHHRGGVSAT